MMEFTLQGVSVLRRTQAILVAGGVGGATTALSLMATGSTWEGAVVFGFMGSSLVITAAASFIAGPLVDRSGNLDLGPLQQALTSYLSPESKEEFRAAVAETYGLELSEREAHELLELAQFHRSGQLKMRFPKGKPMRLGTSTVMRGQEVMTLTLVHDNGAWLLLRGDQELTPLNYEAF